MGPLQLQSAVDPKGKAAGLATAVSGSGTIKQARVALVDDANRLLRPLAVRGSQIENLASKPLPAGAKAPFALKVTTFDDPLLAVQLLWLNLVTNGIQDVALAFELSEGDVLGRAPRPTSVFVAMEVHKWTWAMREQRRAAS